MILNTTFFTRIYLKTVKKENNFLD